MTTDGGTVQPDSPQLYAKLTVEGPALRARFVNASIGEREGNVVHNMIESHFADMETPLPFVVLDFSDTSFINSAGLGACVMIYKSAQKRNGTVVLYGQRPEIESVFKLSGLHKIFKLAPNDKKLAKILS